MTDPTITIAGLRARINSLLSAVQHSNRTAAERMTMFVEASSNADRLTAERDALAAQLAEVRAELAKAPKVCAIHSYEHGPGPCMTCGAWPPGTRELIAACRTRIAGLEQAANERSAEVARLTAQLEEARGALVDIADDLHVSTIGVTSTDVATRCGVAVARLTARVAELEARPVLTMERLTEALVACRNLAPIGCTPGAADHAAAILAALGPVTLPPAQDRAEELVSAWRGICTDTATCDLDPAERMRRALASLGAPPTSPPVTIDADALYARCERDFMGGYSGPLYDAFKHGMWTVCNVLRSTKPTSPPAARPVFAGVSEEELALEYARAVDRIPGIRAVLARLEVSLVAPVDPEAVARDYANNAATGYAPGIDHPPYWFEYTDEQRTKRTAAMRATLTARGIPVTPEVGK